MHIDPASAVSSRNADVGAVAAATVAAEMPETAMASSTPPNASPPSDTTTAPGVVLPTGIDSGDIVLFNRRCMSMSPQGAALCLVAKLLSNSRWDHVGLVIRHPTTKELLFLEADFGGVKLRSLKERIARSKSNEIAVRKLSIVRTDAMRAKLYAFAARMLGRPYEIGTAGFLKARVADPFSKTDRDRRHALLVEKRAAVLEIDRELRSVALTQTSRKVLTAERARVVKLIADLEAALIQELGVPITAVKQPSPSVPPSATATAVTQTDDLARVFCSELVAAAYQDIGLLDSYPLAAGYNPKDFSTEQKSPPGLHLLKSARLSDEVFIRRQESKQSLLAPIFSANANAKVVQTPDARSASEPTLWGAPFDGTAGKARASGVQSDSPLVRGVGSGDAPPRESRRLIREVLKRTPLYDKIPDEYKWSHLSKSFTACVVEAGDVVFTQGEYGDKIYVIESGAVDRFIAKTADEDPVLVHSMGPRNSFGLTGFTFNCPRGATIRASERSLIWSVDRATFELFRDTTSPIQSLLSEADQRTLRGLLKEHFLFKRLDTIGPAELNMFFVVKFRAGEEIFKQGERGDNFYIIKSGEVERHIRHPRLDVDDGDNADRNIEDDHTTLASTLWPGQSFGELSILYNAPRSATVRARIDTECWAISSESFHKLNFGEGTYYLQAIFKRFASVSKDGKAYMTPSDLLNFADLTAFQDPACRDRLSSLLISLVTSNREHDPIRSFRKPSNSKSTSPDDRDAELLMDFWEFVRFDLVLNQPFPEKDFAFRLANQSNTGFVTLHEMHSLLQDYVDIDPVARDLLNGQNTALARVFGRNGARVLSSKEFERVSHSILPPTFINDLQHLTQHMLNMDVSTNSHLLKDPDLEKLSFMEPDGSPSMLGSQFVVATRGGQSNRISLFGSSIPWTHLLSIFVSGTLSRTVVAPFDRLKIIMQTQPTSKRYRGVISGIRAMIADDTSLFRALFRGNGANVIRIVPSAAIQLLVVDRLHWYTKSNPGLSRESLGLAQYSRAVDAVIIGGVAGIAAASATYPLDYVRGRLALQKRGFERYRGTLHGLRLSIQEEGPLSIYRGLTPSLIGVFPYVGLSFAMYETVQPLLPKKNDGSSQPTWSSQIVAGVLASATGQVAAYPLDTVRRRMQVAGFARGCDIGHEGMVGSLREIVRLEGVRGLFRGLTPNLIKAAPAGAVSFFVYERCINGLDAVHYLVARDARTKKRLDM